MSKVILTDSRLKALHPSTRLSRSGKPTCEILWDAAQPGLAVRVSPKGRRTWVVIRRRAGAKRLTFHTLGSYPAMTLKAAREATPAILLMLARGEHPKELQRAKLREAVRLRENTFGSVAEKYIARTEFAKMRTRDKVESVIQRELLGRRRVKGQWLDSPGRANWRNTPIAEISRRDVIAMVGRVASPWQAPKALVSARQIFDFAVDLGQLEVSPCSGRMLKRTPGSCPPRTRVLSNDELRLIWASSLRVGFPFGSLVRLLLLTGCRRNEISDARWGEIDLGAALLTIPGERFKTGSAHSVPLVAGAVALLGELPRFASGDYVLSTTAGRRPVSGFSKMKLKLEQVVRELQGEAAGDLPQWGLHDLRRTVRTRLSELGVAPHVAELVIGHKQRGIHAVYDLHSFDAEKRNALLRWEGLLLSIVDPERAGSHQDKVVQLRAGA
jgi:integrase